MTKAFPFGEGGIGLGTSEPRPMTDEVKNVLVSESVPVTHVIASENLPFGKGGSRPVPYSNVFAINHQEIATSLAIESTL